MIRMKGPPAQVSRVAPMVKISSRNDDFVKEPTRFSYKSTPSGASRFLFWRRAARCNHAATNFLYFVICLYRPVSPFRGSIMQSFREALATQRWDDHRYYHHSRINQSLHLFSALCFIVAYAEVFKDPVTSALIG